MTVKSNSDAAARPFLAELAEVALIDARTCAAVGGMSTTWWYDQVRAGRAPAPVIRQSRCSRWKLSEVRDYWAARATHVDDVVAARLIARAKAGAEAAKIKRRDVSAGKGR